MLDTIINSPRLSERLAAVWDFDVMAADDDAGFRGEPVHSLQVVAHDAAGGTFALCGDEAGENQPVLFVGSEGKAGLIAPTLESALKIRIALPYWMDCLKFSGGGDLEQMRRTLPHLDRETREDEPNIDEYREALLTGLSLTRLDDPVAALHGYVAGHQHDLSVFGDGGSEFDGLFGPFVVEDNPRWRPSA